MNNEEWKDYKELSGEITEKLDNTATYESWLIIQEYVDRCQEKNKKYKEVIEKAIEYINLIALGETLEGKPVLFKEEAEGQYLLDILKEVE